MATATPASASSSETSSTGSREAVIEIRNLSKIYRDFWGRKKTHAVKSLTLDVYKGEVFGLLGPNGSGKTTTLKMLLGLLFPTDGEIRILGQPASDVEKNEKIGYLPEESYLYRFLNADETLKFYGQLFDMPGGVLKKRADELIKRVGMDHARRMPLKEYSKGMTRRIGLAQALINDPDLILLDEPTSGLDPLGVAEMKDYILELKQQGKTIVLCSHLLADVEEVCDRVAILYEGELKELGRLDELLVQGDRTELETSELDEAAVAEIREVLAKHGASLESVRKPRESLKTLFERVVRESRARPGMRHVSSGTAPASDPAKPGEPVKADDYAVLPDKDNSPS